jgi:adenine/guanine phosphoribosyltransferase-like PRPP-binding protein
MAGIVAPRGSRVLLVDDWVETGAQARAAISLIEQHGGIVAGVASIQMDHQARTTLSRLGYRCFTILET